MVLRIPCARSFRVYIRRNGPDGVPEAVFVYWDTPDGRKTLIDPFLYEHAAHCDLEGRIVISCDSDAENSISRYLWGFYTDELDSDEVPEALSRVSRERGSEFREFLRSCYDSMTNSPNEPFRAVLNLKRA